MILVNKMTSCHGIDETLSTKLFNFTCELQVFTKVIMNAEFEMLTNKSRNQLLI